MNAVHILGRLTADPENKPVGSTSVTSFTIAVRRKYPNKDGNYDTDFVDCQCWGKTGETIAKYFRKSSNISVTGSLRSDKWVDKDTGKNRTKWFVNVDEFDFTDRKPEAQSPAVSNDYSAPDDSMKVAPLSESEENDLPF